LWEFPGGEINTGESGIEGLQRHLKERLGLTTIAGRPLALVAQTLTHRELEIRGFECLFQGRLRPRWYQEVRWIPRGELAKAPLTAGMRRLAVVIAGRDPDS